MITKVIEAQTPDADQWSDPIRVYHDQRPIIHVRETTTPFTAVVSVQIMDDLTLPTPPALSDDTWHTIKTEAVDSAGALISGLPGNAWYRVGVSTGNYVSGEAEATLKTERVGGR